MRYTWRRRSLASRVATLLAAAACTVPASDLRRETVVYASGADLQSINPLLAVHPLAKAVQKHVLFVTLAAYDASLQPVPRLARWTWNRDSTTLTFALRRDVVWHDGRPTTAWDVETTLRLARDPRVAYARARDLEAVTQAAVVDSFTIRLEFARRQPTFPDVLTDLAILPAHHFATLEPGAVRATRFNREPVGNGPFRFVAYRPNDRWVFEQNPQFPKDLGQPEIERLVIAVVSEPATKLAALTAGELDFAGIAPSHAAFVRDNPRLRVVDYPILFVTAVIWNLRREPFADPAVRRALTMAIDRELLVAAHAYGFARVAAGPVPPEHPWYEPVTALPYDPARARALLAERGWRPGRDGILVRDGRRFTVELLTVGSGALPLEQMIQAQLLSVGVELRIRPLELNTFLGIAQSEERAFDALQIGIPGDLALGYVAALFASGGGPLAYSGYVSAEFDAAVRAVNVAANAEDLAAAWRRAQRILERDHPVTWLYHSRGVQGATRRILAPAPDLRGELATLAEWRILSAR